MADGLTDVAAKKFLNLLEELRTDFLQDCALLMGWYPNHPIWSQNGAHEIFLTPEFRAFSEAVHAAILTASHEDHVSFSTVTP